MNRFGWRAWCAAGAIFVLGCGTGITSTVMVGKRVLRQLLAAPADAPGPADRAAARVADDLADALALSPADAAAVRAVLADSAQRLKSIRRHAAVEVAEELRDATARIAAKLPPEKRAGLYRVMGQRFTRIGLMPPPPPPASAPAP